MIFGNTATRNEFENKNFGIDIANESCLEEIFLDTTRELVAIESATYVADIMLESAALDGENIEPLLEGVMSGVWEKLKYAMKKLVAKIKEWFKKIKKMFGILFTSGKEFVKKYKTDILKAEAMSKGFSYTMYDYNFNTLATGPSSVVKDTGSDAVQAAETIIGTKTVQEALEDKKNDFLNNKTKAEALTEWKELLQGGDTTEEFEDFNGGPQVSQMLNIIENGEKLVKEYDKFEQKETSALNKIIKEIEAAEKNNTANIKTYQLATQIASFEADYNISKMNVHAKVLKSAIRSSQGVLKRLLMHRPKKESFGGFDNTGSESTNLLESAMASLGL